MAIALTSCTAFDGTTPEDGNSPALRGELVAPTFGFESGTCQGWTRTGGTTEAIDGGHAGAKACQLCAGATGGGTLTQSFESAPNTRYILRVWARGPAPPATSGSGVRLTLSVGATATGIADRPLPADGSFSYYETALEARAGGQLLAGLSTSAGPGVCIVFDDVSLTREPL